MKIIFLLMAVAFTISNSFAAINLLCMTETPTTSFVAQTENDLLKIRLIHHNGVKYMPIYNGVITPNDLGTLSDRADAIADIGVDLNFEIPIDSCQSQDEYLFNCFKSMPEKNLNGHKVSIWSVYTSRSIDQSFAGTFNYIETTMAIDIDGKSYYLPMKYSENECFLEFKKDKKNFKLKLLQ